MGNTTDPRQGLPEPDFKGMRGEASGSGFGLGMGEGTVEGDVNWIYEMAWYGEAVRGDGFICEEHPAKLSSDGLWEKMTFNERGLRFWQYRLPNLELVILLVFILWQFFNILFMKMGLKIPKFTSMMLAGLLLNVLLMASGKKSIIEELLFPKNRIDIPGCLGSFGFMIFWFLKGVRMDMKRILKSEAKPRVTGVAAVTFPILVGAVIYLSKPPAERNLLAQPYAQLLLMESLTSFSGIARLLRDLDMNHSSLGRVALSAALVSDMVGLFYMLTWIPIKYPDANGIFLLVEILFYLVISFAVARPIMFKIIKRKREGRPIDDKYIYAIIIMVCLACVYWHDIDQFPALGAFIFGLAIPNGPPIGSELVERLESFNFGLILPLFITSSMLRTDISAWKNCLRDDAKLAVTSLVVLVFLLKLSVTVIVPYLYKMPLRDSVLLSLIMCHKGIIELSFYLFMYSGSYLIRDTFSILVLSIVVNSFIIPVTIGFLYDPTQQFLCYQKRNLAIMKNTGELKTLVCIHRPDHISSMINLLEASYQSEESPLTCYVLHLVELQGQDVPTLISHKVQKLGVGTGTKYSENVILSFEHFHRYVCSSISIDTFTCIANANHMQDDICWLALDKAVTLIILPFHRTWSLDRTSVVSDSEMIRFLNFNVLKQAPCSVGILIERHLVTKKQEVQENLKVCAIFVGGKDDREALAFAKRMALQENVTLTVLRLVATGKNKETTGWDQMLDSVDLRDVMQSNEPGTQNNEPAGTIKEDVSTIYLEQEIIDGADTSMLLRSMAFDYDLFIVGRTCGENHEATRGIENWCEFEELGVIGDFLASPDFPSKTSVLVVQQQRTVSQ
ncbi:Cation/H(+) antiporter 8 [Hirschfeldia incana]|nr:Cation/H(+) antiporter 8 [Hirschfeldia incana]